MSVRLIIRRRDFLQATSLAVASLAAPGIAIRAARAAPTVSPIVEISNGKLQGLTKAGAFTFKGIRYGAPTGGANRFMPPAPVTPWAGVQDATNFGHSAPQNAFPLGSIGEWYNEIEPISEDCLFLNVFTPSLARGSRRPVMVWLHGGAWSSCSGTAPGFDGSNLARYGDVVVVTINHRLNLFGYLELGTKDTRFADAGNAGVLDMVAALRWVHENIDGFGGDPGNVTIFGQSGGASKVTALLDMPAAKGLFHKAVVQSCSGGLRFATMDEALGQAQTLANQLGMQNADGAALQKVPMATLLTAMKRVPDPFRPVLDERSFTQHPFDGAPTPISANVPMLIGNAATEATLFLASDPRNFTITEEEAVFRAGRFMQTPSAETQHIVNAYHAAMGRVSPFHLLGQIATDFMFRRNTTRIAALKATQAAPVYDYVFNWKTPIFGGILLSPHTSEVPFVFGTTPQAAGLLGTGPDLPHVQRIVMGAWAAFAHTGNPNTQHTPHWPVYTDERKATMVLDVESRVAVNPGGQARSALDPLPYFQYSMPQNFAQV
jgi:para-nitrobenzyl esterase